MRDGKHYGLRRNSVNMQGTVVVNNVNGKTAKEYCNKKVNSSRKNLYRSGSWLWKYQDSAPGISDWNRVL